MSDANPDFGDSFRTTTRPATRLVGEIVETSREYMSRVGRVMGVNSTDLSAIQIIMMDGPLTPREIATRLDMSPAAVTTIVDRLEAAGKVTRSPHPTDRRAIIVTVSPEAVQNAMASVLPVALAIDDVLDEFDLPEQEVVTRYLSRVLTVHRELLPD